MAGRIRRTEASDEKWMGRALRLARSAAARGEVPIGALVVSAGRVLGRGSNRPIAARDPTAHAEIVALRRAGRAARNYRLTGATLYVTLEPCLMCLGAMVHARVGRLVYGAPDPRIGATRLLKGRAAAGLNHRVTVRGGVRAAEAAGLLREFFRARRGRAGAGHRAS
jgi:tRNA(adenine34) deaminase